MAEVPPSLLAAARGGDADAVERLLAASRSYLNVLADVQMEPWMGAKFDASDIVQQSLIDAHAGVGAFDGDTEGQWKAYLKKVLNHNLQDVVRRYKATEKRDVRRERNVEFADGSSRPLPATDPTPSRLTADAERDLELAAAIDSLPPDYREVIVARNLRKEPFAAIAERLGRSEAATQMLWTRAVRKLEGVLQGRSELAD